MRHGKVEYMRVYMREVEYMRHGMRHGKVAILCEARYKYIKIKAFSRST